MQSCLSLVDDWIKVNIKSVIAAVIAVLIAPVLLAPIVDWSGLSHEAPRLQIVRISNFTPAYDDNMYSDVTAAV
jgi:hypothetical protein